MATTTTGDQPARDIVGTHRAAHFEAQTPPQTPDGATLEAPAGQFAAPSAGGDLTWVRNRPLVRRASRVAPRYLPGGDCGALEGKGLLFGEPATAV